MAVQIGIDAGTSGVRRVAVELKWGKATVVEAPRQATEVVAVPSAGMTFRNLSFPFHDRGRLHNLVAQELEHSLAFPLTDAVWDFAARPPSEDFPDNIFAVACPRARLNAALQPLGGLQPEVIDVEPFAYQRILALAGQADGLLLDLGASRTTTCRVRAGHLDYVRGLQRGGKALTDALARTRKIAVSEAENLKKQQGLEAAEVREYYERLLEDALLPQEPLTTPLYVTGGGSRTPGLLQWLANRTRRPVELLPLPTEVGPEEAVAFGMALWGGKGMESVNLQSGLQGGTSTLARIALWAALILGIFTLDRAATAFMLGSSVNRYEKAISGVVKQAAPEVNAAYDPLGQLRSRVSTLKNGGQGGNALHVLGAVAKAMQQSGSAAIKVSELSVAAGSAKIRGEAGSIKDVEALKGGLADLGKVDSETNSAPSGGRVSFTLNVELKGQP